MNNYKQITRDERAVISNLWIKRKSYYFIANWMNRKYDTIRDEIERNGEVNRFGKLIYSLKKAHKRYLERRKESKKESRIMENNFKVEEKLIELITTKQLSPE